MAAFACMYRVFINLLKASHCYCSQVSPLLTAPQGYQNQLLFKLTRIEWSTSHVLNTHNPPPKPALFNGKVWTRKY